MGAYLAESKIGVHAVCLCFSRDGILNGLEPALCLCVVGIDLQRLLERIMCSNCPSALTTSQNRGSRVGGGEGTQVAKAMERCALAAVALAPRGIQLDRLVGIVKRLLEVAQRGIARRPVRVEHVVARIKLDRLHTRNGCQRCVALDDPGRVRVVPLSRPRLHGESPWQRTQSHLLP